MWLLPLKLFFSSPAASQKGLGATDSLDVSFPLFVFQMLFCMWVSGCWKADSGGSSMILGRGLKSPVELRARENCPLVSESGNGSGKVIVITEIVKKRRKMGEMSSSHFSPQQSFDHPRHAWKKKWKKERQKQKLVGDQQNHDYNGVGPWIARQHFLLNRMECSDSCGVKKATLWYLGSRHVDSKCAHSSHYAGGRSKEKRKEAACHVILFCDITIMMCKL